MWILSSMYPWYPYIKNINLLLYNFFSVAVSLNTSGHLNNSPVSAVKHVHIISGVGTPLIMCKKKAVQFFTLWFFRGITSIKMAKIKQSIKSAEQHYLSPSEGIIRISADWKSEKGGCTKSQNTNRSSTLGRVVETGIISVHGHHSWKNPRTQLFPRYAHLHSTCTLFSLKREDYIQSMSSCIF